MPRFVDACVLMQIFMHLLTGRIDSAYYYASLFMELMHVFLFVLLFYWRIEVLLGSEPT